MKNNQTIRIRNTRNALIISNCVILVAVLIIAFLMMFSRMTESKNKNISSLASFSSSLLKERFIDHMDNTEKTCDLFFASANAGFYPDEGSMSRADINKTLDEITSELLGISLSDYYADLGIAYEDGSTAGVITDSREESITLVESSLPPIPTSTRAISQFFCAKKQKAAAVWSSNRVG